MAETIETTTIETATQPYRVHPKYGVCLDAGCGTGPKRPAADFSCYCDVIPVRAGVQYPDPYYCAPLEDMSCFGDKQFDWVRSHHSIEHTTDPDKACSEIVRIGKAGVLSFPTPQAEQMFGRRDHNWFVYIDRGRLLFVAKRYACYGVPRSETHCELNQDFYWKESFEWKVVL